MSIESPRDLEGMRRIGRVVAETLRAVRETLRVGMTGLELDAAGLAVFRRHGAVSAPKRRRGFPAHLLISVNDAAVHGIPSGRPFRSGDLVTIDATAELDGYIADAAVTIALPGASDQARRLIRCAESAFLQALRVARAGRPVRDIGEAVEREANRRGFRVLKELTGHGVGRDIHEPPTIPNFGTSLVRGRLTEGLVAAIEPILAVGTERTILDPDGWTIRTANGSLSAHYEHTILVTRGRPVVLTAA